MSPLIESIKLLDGKFFNLPYHQQRVTRSLNILYRTAASFDIEKYLLRSQYPQKGLFKCRIVYDNLRREVAFTPYEPKTINRVKIVEDNEISYEFKFQDRRHIDRLFQQRGDCDDVLIVKRGKITDCSFSNIAFRKGEQWFTPTSPLLNGTMRQKLMDENKILCREIWSKELRSFETFKMMNAMLEFKSAEIEVSEIVL